MDRSTVLLSHTLRRLLKINKTLKKSSSFSLQLLIYLRMHGKFMHMNMCEVQREKINVREIEEKENKEEYFSI